MARLWFSVIGIPNQGITVRVHHGNRYEEQPEILKKIKELINTGQRSSLRTLTQEFPQDLRAIEALDNLLSHYRIKDADGIHWSGPYCHTIHIYVCSKS